MATTPRADAQAGLQADLGRVLLSEKEIAARVAELGAQIARDYRNRDLVLIGILKGGLFFLSDLSRQIEIAHELELVGAHSYGGDVHPAAEVRITKDSDRSLEGRDLLIVEDIYDTGNTLRAITEMVRMDRPRSVEVCALMVKRKDHRHAIPIRYVGFEIDDVFVVGYGLDYRERYRNLRCVGVLLPEIYE